MGLPDQPFMSNIRRTPRKRLFPKMNYFNDHHYAEVAIREREAQFFISQYIPDSQAPNDEQETHPFESQSTDTEALSASSQPSSMEESQAVFRHNSPDATRAQAVLQESDFNFD